MSDTPAASTDPPEGLRRRRLARAAAAFDLTVHPDHPADPVTVDQREARAREPGCDLSTWLIQRHATAADLARPAADRPVYCPECGRSAWRETNPGTPPPGRRLTGLG